MGTAANTFAALTRQQWQDYVATYVPIENKLIEYATDSTQPAKAMAEASENVTNAFSAQQSDFARQMKGLGTTLTADETAAQTRAAGLSKSLADVQAQNQAQAATKELQYGLLSGGSSGASSAAIAAAMKSGS